MVYVEQSFCTMLMEKFPTNLSLQKHIWKTKSKVSNGFSTYWVAQWKIIVSIDKEAFICTSIILQDLNKCNDNSNIFVLFDFMMMHANLN